MARCGWHAVDETNVVVSCSAQALSHGATAGCKLNMWHSSAELVIIQHQLTNLDTNVQTHVHAQRLKCSFQFVTDPEAYHTAV